MCGSRRGEVEEEGDEWFRASHLSKTAKGGAASPSDMVVQQIDDLLICVCKLLCQVVPLLRF